jgi:uncharacterized protein YecA (UPF0149 family)
MTPSLPHHQFPGIVAAMGSPKVVANAIRGVGRNMPCPCKSGKKFKKCCRVRIEVYRPRR